MRIRWVRRAVVAPVVLGTLLGAAGLVQHPAHAASEVTFDLYVVTSAPGEVETARQAVTRNGGSALAALEIMDGFVASIPSSVLDRLAAEPSITGLTLDRLMTPEWSQLQSTTTAYSPWTDPGSMFNTTYNVGVAAYWWTGYRGDGVGVAVVDTGMDDEHPTLRGRIAAAVDFSGENDPTRDGTGHGTYVGSIIAGEAGRAWESNQFRGVAPDAHLINVKVADHTGATSSVRLLAGLDWVYQHRDDPSLDIRVLNLSFGATPLSDPLADPLSVAVERLWDAGIVVVAAAGNDGLRSGLLAPAYDPYVIAAGATDHVGTLSPWDDTVAPFSASSESGRTVDVVAPGTSIQGAAASGSLAAASAGAIGNGYVRGSGTSQAAAVVSGAVALVVDHRPSLTPDQVKKVLERSSRDLAGVSPIDQGAGTLDLLTARFTQPTGAGQTWTKAVGTGQVVGTIYSDALAATSRWTTSRWTTSRWLSLWS